MKVGLIGLGKMGANMARRLRRSGIEVVGLDLNESVTRQLAGECGVEFSSSPAGMVNLLTAPRVVWLMLPAGEPTAGMLAQLQPLLAAGDIVVDGGNTHYRESQLRAAEFQAQGIGFVDSGTSGGIRGLENGYALMLGGEKAVVARIEPVLKALTASPDKGWLHCGPSGAGHFVKMIHNGLEYGLMQAYAEAFALMKGKAEFGMDLAAIAEMWRHGSVVRSWLLDLTAGFLAEDQQLEAVEPYVTDSGQGRWTVLEAVEQGVPAPAISLALMSRFGSQGKADFGNKLMAMMRKGFGGHAVKQTGESS